MLFHFPIFPCQKKGTRSALVCAAGTIAASLVALSFLSLSAQAQVPTPENDSITVRYLRDDGTVVDSTPAPINNNPEYPSRPFAAARVANLIIEKALYLHNTASPPPALRDEFGEGDPEPPQEFARLEDGSAFVVTPTIDPELRLNYNFLNQSGATLTGLTISLQPGVTDLYFNESSSFTAVSSNFSNVIFYDPINNGADGRFRSVDFSIGGRQTGLTSGTVGFLSLAINVPGTIGTSYVVQVRPVGTPELAFAAPEPGTFRLLLLVGIISLPAMGVNIRNRSRIRTHA